MSGQIAEASLSKAPPPFTVIASKGFHSVADLAGLGLTTTDAGLVVALTLGSPSRSLLVETANAGRWGQRLDTRFPNKGRVQFLMDDPENYTWTIFSGRPFGYVLAMVHRAAVPDLTWRWQVGQGLILYSPPPEDPIASDLLRRRLEDAFNLPILPDWWPRLWSFLEQEETISPCEVIGRSPELVRVFVDSGEITDLVLKAARERGD